MGAVGVVLLIHHMLAYQHSGFQVDAEVCVEALTAHPPAPLLWCAGTGLATQTLAGELPAGGVDSPYLQSVPAATSRSTAVGGRLRCADG